MDSDSDSEDFVSYGTPLKNIEEDEPLPKPIAVQDQVVKDRQGRQRFHGAFTGGFSAGFFNTVGSKEGFTPSTFVSSRGKRADKQSQRAEDYMDNDDMGEYGIAPRKVIATQNFAGERREGKKRAPEGSNVIPDDGRIQDIIRPTDETIGTRLLRRMGWKPGQGIGPKFEKHKKKKKKRGSKMVVHRTYGCSRPPGLGGSASETGANESDGDKDEDDAGDDETDSEDDFMRGFLFAPDDIQDFIFALKDDTHGIGYRGIDSSRAVLGGHITLFEEPVKGKSGRQGISGHAFGVGAFEDDDDDVYSSDRLSNYDRMLGGEDEGKKKGLFGWTGPPPTHAGDDGSLEGFKAASQKKLTTKVFHPPALPRDFRPFHQFKSSSSATPRPPEVPTSSSSRFTLSATQRAAMLGEEQLPGPSFDEMLKEIRNKVTASQPTPPLTQQSEKPQSRWDRGAPQGPSPALGPSPSLALGPSPVPGPMPGAAGSGFKPFAKNPEKQQRYEGYLQQKRLGLHPKPVTVGDARTEWERQQELEEFSRAASLYQPMSGIMSSRFVTAKLQDDIGSDTVEVPAEAGGDENDQSKAAEMKMFGQLTRDTFEWHPDKLLCKRFNIADPYPGSTIVGLPTVKKDKFSVFNFLEVSQQPATSARIDIYPPQPQADSSHGVEESDQSRGPPAHSASSQKRSRWDQHPGVLATIDDQEEEEEVKMEKDGKRARERDDHQIEPGVVAPGIDAEEKPRPPMDLFQAIFQDSGTSSDEDNSEEDDEELEEKEKDKEVAVYGHRDVKGAEVSMVTTSSMRDDQHDVIKDKHRFQTGVLGVGGSEGDADLDAERLMSAKAARHDGPTGVRPAGHYDGAGGTDLAALRGSDSESSGDSSDGLEGKEEEAEEEYGPVLPPSLSQTGQDGRGEDVKSAPATGHSDRQYSRHETEPLISNLKSKKKHRSRDRDRSRSKSSKEKRKKKKKEKERKRESSRRRDRSQERNGDKTGRKEPLKEETSRDKRHKKTKKTRHRESHRSSSKKLSSSRSHGRHAGSSSDYDASPSSDENR